MADLHIIATVFVLLAAVTSVFSQADCPFTAYPPCTQANNFYPNLTYPNLDDCSKYWRCENRVARSVDCPPGQMYEIVQHSCVVPQPGAFTCNVLYEGVAAWGTQG